MTKRHGRPKAAGMVNAVLRKFVTNWLDMPELPRGSTADYLSLRYSHPKWLVTRLIDILGAEEAEEYLRCNNAIVPTTIQTNTMKITPEALEGAWGASATVMPSVDGWSEVSGTGDLESLSAFRQGMFTVQDAQPGWSPRCLRRRKPTGVLDACAAPGGKSFAGHRHGDRGDILSCDVHPHKLKLIEKAQPVWVCAPSHGAGRRPGATRCGSTGGSGGGRCALLRPWHHSARNRISAKPPGLASCPREQRAILENAAIASVPAAR